MVCRFSFVLFQQGRGLARLDAVEADVQGLGLAVDDGKLVAWKLFLSEFNTPQLDLLDEQSREKMKVQNK